MRILHVTHQYPPDNIGGVELHTQALLRELAVRGHEVAVFYRRSMEGKGVEQRRDGAVTVWVAWSGFINPTNRFLATFRDESLLTAFRTVLATVKPDVVHVQHLMGLPAAIVDIVYSEQIPFIATLHDYWWLCANAQLLTNDTEEICDGPNLWVNCGRCALARAGQVDKLWLAPAVAPLFAYRHRILTTVAKKAARIVAPTRFTFEAYHQLQLPTEKLILIPHGIEVHKQAAASLSRAKQPNVLRVAYIGGIVRQKGLHVLVEAVNLLPHEKVYLDIYGDAEADPAYTAELEALAFHPGICFKGRVPNEQVISTLAAYDVVVVPSLWYETAALVIQEAWAAEVPVIASNLGALAERVHHGENGLLVPPDSPQALAEALRALLDDPLLLQTLQQGIQPVRTLQAQTDAYETLYAEVVHALRQTLKGDEIG